MATFFMSATPVATRAVTVFLCLLAVSLAMAIAGVASVTSHGAVGSSALDSREDIADLRELSEDDLLAEDAGDAGDAGNSKNVKDAEDDDDATHQAILSKELMAAIARGDAENAAALARQLAGFHHKTNPHLIRLRRESVPIYRLGKIASFKTSYSGVLRVGSNSEEFRVIFDTGSGNVVIPGSNCMTESCLVHHRFNSSESSTAVAVNTDGSYVQKGQEADWTTIGYGTGEISGTFVHDKLCLDSLSKAATDGSARDSQQANGGSGAEPCVYMNMIVAYDMSTLPFKTFDFDGILGLGLDALTMSSGFSLYRALGMQGKHHTFAAFLTEGEDEESEMALGGYNPARLLEPLKWSPVQKVYQGYWQVQILAVRVNGKTLDVCTDGTCRGVVDTGTSHLGWPGAHNDEVKELLTADAGDLLDCRLAQAPEVEFELGGGFNITIKPANYMRRLPLREDVSVSSAKGVHLPDEKKQGAHAEPLVVNAPQGRLGLGFRDDGFVLGIADSSPLAGGSVLVGSRLIAINDVSTSGLSGRDIAQKLVDLSSGDRLLRFEASAHSGGRESSTAEPVSAEEPAPVEDLAPIVAVEERATPGNLKRFCTPRLVPVNLPAPVGPKLFILGEPILHRYYTVYDWHNLAVGFGLANNRRNTMKPGDIADSRGLLPKEVDMLLMQQRPTASERAPEDEVIMLQVQVSVSFVVRRRA